MTREGSAAKFVIARLRRSRGNLAVSGGTRESLRRIRRCLLEIAASGLRPPRNDTGGRLSQACHCAPPGGESPPDLSLRGSAGAVAISQYTPGTQESPGEFDSAYLRLPRRACALLAMTREGGACEFVPAPLRVKQAPRFVIARSEATWQSREGTPDPYRPPLKQCWPPRLVIARRPEADVAISQYSLG